MTRADLTVAVGLSGGVDSSVAAWVLKQEGYNVIGLMMKIYDPSIGTLPALKDACFGPSENKDMETASRLCEFLGIPFHCIDLTKEYRSIVLEYFRQQYLSGRTPNPCVVCNRRIKFDFLIKKARAAGISFDYFATGHYARVKKLRDRFVLMRSMDPKKDQSYFLYGLSQQQLSRILFPLGEFSKEKVRELARSIGLPTAERPESQDFLSGGDYSLLFRAQEIKPGDIVDIHGNVLGRHKGIIFYTVGQRKGLGISHPDPLYVTRIDPQSNRIIVGAKKDLESRKVLLSNLNYISISSLTAPMEVTAKIRYRHREAPATLYPQGKNKALLVFHSPQRAVTPGQSAVFYSGDYVVGGGIIEQAIHQ
ncbi:MAG: tRNA 2-thiouridine(34) synthase MnmA [Deltaproteobacteria bacterium]|nr:MAG: tRNA 2-thiouridine(34) synthase MnmA [Deltaproteobacteria bacterium]